MKFGMGDAEKATPGTGAVKPSEKARQRAAVFDRAAATYSRVGPGFFAHFGGRLAELVAPPPGARILDIAAGTGAASFPASLRVGEMGMVVGTDRAPLMIGRLAEEIRRRGVRNVLPVLMDAQRLAFPDGSFDAVLCGFALDLFPDPARALREFNRVLRADGRVGLSISSSWWWEGDDRWKWHGELMESLGVGAGLEPRQFATSPEVEEALLGARFVDVRVGEERFGLTFADPEEWWRWAWSHGYRGVLEAMSPGQLEQYREACFRELRRMAASGGIRGRLEVVLATARRRGYGPAG